MRPNKSGIPTYLPYPTSSLKTHFKPFFLRGRMVKAALPHLHEGYSIMAISPVDAYEDNQQFTDYPSTSGALTAHIGSISQQLAQKKIRPNPVAFGPIWTPFIPPSMMPDKVAKLGQKTTLTRASQPPKVALASVFLTLNDTSNITGQAIHPNDG